MLDISILFMHLMYCSRWPLKQWTPLYFWNLTSIRTLIPSLRPSAPTLQNVASRRAYPPTPSLDLDHLATHHSSSSNASTATTIATANNGNGNHNNGTNSRHHPEVGSSISSSSASDNNHAPLPVRHNSSTADPWASAPSSSSSSNLHPASDVASYHSSTLR